MASINDLTKPDNWISVEALNDYHEKTKLPSGGTTGQVLTKKSNDDGDVDWQDANTIFIAEYGVTAYADIDNAATAGKFILVSRELNGTSYYALSDKTSDGSYYFRTFSNSANTNYGCYITKDGTWAVNSYSYATLSSPTFTGTPKAPTATAGTNSTQIATTAFVGTALKGANGNLAPIEATTTASQAYGVDDYLVYGGQLYKVITAIASGGTIVPTGSGANVVATTVVENLGGGSSLPSGGTTGQVLSKHSDTDGDVEWTTPSSSDPIYMNVTTNAATPVVASANANNSVAVGYDSKASGLQCVAVGYNANASNSSAVALGFGAQANKDFSIAVLYAKSSGYGSVAIGSVSNAAANYSIALGYQSSARSNNAIALGYRSNASFTNSMAIGVNSNTQGQLSIAIGYDSKGTGSIATAVGYNANVSGNSAYYGTAIGAMANVNGTQGTAIGYKSYSSGTNSTAIGQNANTTTDNTIQLGDTNISSLKCKVQLTTTSDIRDKTDIEPIPNAIDFLNEIEPLTYVSNMRSLYEYDYSEKVINKDGSIEIIDNNPYKEYGFTPYDKEEHAKGTKKGERRRSGVSAQNVREAMIKIYGTDNYANLINDDMYDRENVPPEVESHLGVQYECFVPFLIKAIQELDARVKELEGRI